MHPQVPWWDEYRGYGEKAGLRLVRKKVKKIFDGFFVPYRWKVYRQFGPPIRKCTCRRREAVDRLVMNKAIVELYECLCVWGEVCAHVLWKPDKLYYEIRAFDRGAGFFRVLQNESLSSRSRSKILNSESGFSFFEVWEEFFGKFVFLWPTKSIRRTLL